MKVNSYKKNTYSTSPQKLLLCLLPFWTPMTPPQSISQLKNYIQTNSSHLVKAVDFNVMNEFEELYNLYFETLKNYIPEDKQGSFYNLGQDVIQNHMMAYINCTDIDEYNELVRLIISNNYFCVLTEEQIESFNYVISEMFSKLEDNLVNLIEAEKPDVIGIDVYNTSLAASVFSARLVRDRYPHIKIVMGGGMFIWQLPPESSDFNKFVEAVKKFVDMIYVGLGNKIFLDYLNGELEEEKIVYISDELSNKNIDSEIVIPNLDDFNVQYYPYLFGIGSVSCPFDCGFCIANKYYGKYRKRDIKKVVTEIETLSKKYGRKLFFMNDSLLNPIIMDFCNELIKNKVSIYFDSFLRADEASANIDNTLLWRKAGFYKARIGVESGSQRLLDIMNKGTKIEQLKATISGLAYAGIKTTALWIVGHPGETEEDFLETLNLLEELKDDIYEVECNQFFYYHTYQTSTESWEDKATLLYSEKFSDKLMLPTWFLDCEPSREEAFDRINRFALQCKKLGIPTPNNMQEIHFADKRWKRLHRNSAPPLVEIQNNQCIDNRENLVKMNTAARMQIDDTKFGFEL